MGHACTVQDRGKTEYATTHGVAYGNENHGARNSNGKAYYYENTREGDRVRSRYVGSGDEALFFAVLDAERREEAREETEAERAELAKLYAEEDRIAGYLGAVDKRR